jgi:hypothetical protein
MADMQIHEDRRWRVSVARTEGDNWPDYHEPYGGPLVRPSGLSFTIRLDKDGPRMVHHPEVRGNVIRKDGSVGRPIGASHFLPLDAAFHEPYVDKALAEIAAAIAAGEAATCTGCGQPLHTDAAGNLVAASDGQSDPRLCPRDPPDRLLHYTEGGTS